MENRNIELSENGALGFSDRVRATFFSSSAYDIVSVLVLLIKCRIMILVLLEIIGHDVSKLFHVVIQQTLVLFCARGVKSSHELTSNRRQSCTEVSVQMHNDSSLVGQWREAIRKAPILVSALFVLSLD